MMGFFMRCANPAAPSGGPRDSIPPKILRMTPKNYSTNFKAAKVYIEFDEYIQLKDAQKEIVIAPPLERRPLFKVKGRGVEIEFKCEFDSATTYKIDFGKALQDNTEGNPLGNFAYVFSTGDVIDSLVMTGQVIDALKGDTIIGGLVYLYNAVADSMSYDSTLFIGEVMSVARTDSMGVFIATNLRDMDYLVYAIADKNSNASYDVGEDMVGFADSVCNPLDMPPFKMWYNSLRQTIEATPQTVIRTFSEKIVRKQNLADTKRPKRGLIQFYFAAPNARVTSIDLKQVDSTLLKKQFTRTRDTLSVWIMQPDSLITDSLTGTISYVGVDSIGGDTIITKKINLFNKRDKVDKNAKPKNQFSVKTDASSILHPYKPLNFTFGIPLDTVNIDMIILEKELVEKKRERDRGGSTPKAEANKENERVKADFEFSNDSINMLAWSLNSKWDLDTKYHLVIPSGTFTDVAGNKNDSLSADFATMNPEKYGVIKLNVTSRDSAKRYIVELIDKSGTTRYRNKFVTEGQSIFEFVESGKYQIKVTRDDNINGEWDTGNLVNRIKPESIALYIDPKTGGKIFETKENWEIELDIDIDKLFE